MDDLLTARNRSILVVTAVTLVLFCLWQLLGEIVEKRPALIELRHWLMGFALVFWFTMLVVAR